MAPAFIGTEHTLPLTSFELVSLNEITIEDLDALKRSMEVDPQGTSPREVRDSLLAGTSALLRFTCDDKRMLFLTQEKRGDVESSLFIWHLGGSGGMVANREYINDALSEFARSREIKFIRGLLTPNEKAMEIIRPFGYEIEFYAVRKEVTNG